MRFARGFVQWHVAPPAPRGRRPTRAPLLARTLPTSREVQCGPAVCLSDRALAGLRTLERSGVAGFLVSTASRSCGPVLVVEIVLDYRCGAVPDWMKIVTGFPFQPRAEARSTNTRAR